MAGDIALTVDHVSKKFRKGQLHDSLRDFVPAMIKRMIRPLPPEALRAREFWALQDVSMQAVRGEALGIIGRNGAGKSTMLKLLAGIMKPTSGTLSVHGRLSAMIEIGAGFHPDLTGRENVFLNGTILGMKREEIRRKFDTIVEFSGLGDFIDTPVKRYSSGMFARLGFSVAAHLDPDILIIDEVLSVGDYLFQRKSLEKMLAVARGGATVIFVSHNLQAVAELCPRTILMERGKIAAEGKTDEVVRKYFDSFSLEAAQAAPNRPVYVSKFNMRGESGERIQFRSGERVRVDVEITARERVEKLALQLGMADEKTYLVFTTSTERLGAPAFTLEAGQSISFGFELTLHLAPATYHVGVALFRYDVQRDYGQFAVGTIFVQSDIDVRGIANLYPRLVEPGAPFA